MNNQDDQTLRDEVLALLGKHPESGMTSQDIYDESELAESIAECGKVLHSLRNNGFTVKDEDGRWRATGKERKRRGSTQKKTSPERKTTAEKKPAPAVKHKSRSEGDLSVGVIANRLESKRGPESFLDAVSHVAETAQEALDEYLLSIGDKRIVEPLLRARDEARRALDMFNLGAGL